MKKKLLTFLLALSVCASSIMYPAEGYMSVWADDNDSEEELEENGFQYKSLENGTVEITGYNGSETNITISSTLGSKSVTSIGEGAFSHCKDITSVTIPNSVTSIGKRAFSGCSSLTSITIPNSVTSIGGSAFSYCSGLTSITIPNSVTSIEEGAFSHCEDITSVTIPNSVTSIGERAFSGCSSLTSITIPNSVTSIGGSAFSYCSGLTSITIPNSVTSIGGSAFSYCSGLTNITIPNSVTSIGGSAFSYCSGLTSITIPSSVTSIGNLAFYDCNVTYTSDSNGYVRYVGEGLTVTVDSGNPIYAVENDILYAKGKDILYCRAGKEGNVTLPSNVTAIGDSAFSKCHSITNITIPDGVTTIQPSAFWGCHNLTDITIPSSVTKIDSHAFRECSSLKDIWYQGTKEQWEKIYIEYWRNGNDMLLHATKHYNSGSTTPTPPDSTQQPPASSTPTITAMDSSNVQLFKTSVTYNGKAQTPPVTVRDNNGNIVDATNYTVSYSNNKNIGQAFVTVAFSGNYSGTVKKTFNIVPKGTSLSKVTAQKKGFTVKWKKQTKQTTGYEIQYSTSSKFKGAKTVKNIKAKTTTKRISKLKAKKRYYVRIRTYKTVKGKKYYSGWSKSKKVVTKK